MEELVEYMYQQLKESSLSKAVNEYLSPSPDFLKNLISSYYESEYRKEDVREKFRKVKKDSFNRTKRRWGKGALNNYELSKNPKKEILGELRWMNKYMEQYGKEEFQKNIQITSIDSFVQNRKEEIKDWMESPTKLLHTYPYFKEKSKNQRDGAIKTDILFLMGGILCSEEYKSSETIHQSPFSVVNSSFFGISSRGKISIENEVVENTDGVFYPVTPSKKFAMPPNTNLLVSKGFVDDLNKKVGDLVPGDFEMFIEILSMRDYDFQATRRITFPLGKLVKRTYDSDNSKNYKLTTERLLKLANFKLNQSNDQGEYEVKGLFSDLKIYNDAIGGKMVSAYVSENVYDDYLRQQMINIYTDKVLELKGSFAYHLVFVLQKERLNAHRFEKTTSIKRNWMDFRYAIRYNRRTKKENIEELDNTLKAIEDQQFVIKSFRRSADTYFLEFHPLTERELKDSVIINQIELTEPY